MHYYLSALKAEQVSLPKLNKECNNNNDNDNDDDDDDDDKVLT